MVYWWCPQHSRCKRFSNTPAGWKNCVNIFLTLSYVLKKKKVCLKYYWCLFSPISVTDSNQSSEYLLKTKALASSDTYIMSIIVVLMKYSFVLLGYDSASYRGFTWDPDTTLWTSERNWNCICFLMLHIGWFFSLWQVFSEWVLGFSDTFMKVCQH